MCVSGDDYCDGRGGGVGGVGGVGVVLAKCWRSGGVVLL